MSGSLHDDLHNPYLFDENEAGEYTYSESSTGGKTAEGSLKLDSDPARDAKAQSSAGGDLRRDGDHEWGADDGGHIIGARFGGETGEENLTAQNRNLNRGGYKSAENDWANHLKSGDKVYVHMETDSADRPNAYMGYAIFEDKEGNRTFETYHFVNESRDSVEQWEDEAAEYEAAHPEDFEDMPESETPYGDINADHFDYADISEPGEDNSVETGTGLSEDNGTSNDLSEGSDQSNSME